VLKKRLDLRANWKHYLILGFFNSALPFLLFAFGARTLSASVLSVLNATAPMWGALIGARVDPPAISCAPMLGLLLGTAGVALLVGFDHVSTQARRRHRRRGGAGAACATASPACTRNRRKASSPSPTRTARCGRRPCWCCRRCPSSRCRAAHPGIVGAVLALGVLCSGIAYLIYFRLIEEVGPTSALTVTFLNPVFGILWGMLFLGEPSAGTRSPAPPSCWSAPRW
jgi:drug/metabolite transporter (DMT)-like permease